jgi:hypothetical protein
MEPEEPAPDLVALADLRPGTGTPEAPEAVDKDSLDDYLRRCAPCLELGPDGPRLEVREFRDFRPERLAERLPAALTLLSFRRKLLEAAEGKATPADVREAMGTLGRHPELVRALEAALARPPAPAGPAPPEGATVFDLVDAAPTAAEARNALDRLIGELLAAPGGEAGPSPARLRHAADLVDRSLAPVLLGVLHHPSFLELEAAWRGLRFLARSTDFRAGTRLHVLPVGRRDLVRAVREAALPFADERRSLGRTVVLLLDFPLGEPEEAAAIARAGAGRSVPVVAAAGTPDPARELRGKPETRWLALAANRFLARLPYGKGQDPVKGMLFEEGAARAWARTPWLLGALIADSFARTGWGVDFAGPSAAERLEPLPAADPLESRVSEPRARELADAGLLAFVSRPNSDRAFAASGAAVYDAPEGEPPGSLRHALFAAQIAASLERIVGYLDPSRGLDEVARTLGAALQLLGLTPGGRAYAVTATPSKEGRPGVKLAVRPAGPPLAGLPELALDVPLPLV